MDFLKRLEAESPWVKRYGIIISAFVAGLFIGLWFRNEQATTAKNEAASTRSLLSIREAEIVVLREQLRVKDEAATKVPADEGGSTGSEGAAPPAKKWPSDPDTDVVETGKPKDDPAGWKIAPLPNN